MTVGDGRLVPASRGNIFRRGKGTHDAPAEVARAVAELPVARHFEHLLFSCDFGSAKPDPACFGQALDRLGAPAGEVIFIDDREDNVGAAIGMGMRGIQFTGPEQARAGLAGIIGTDRLLSG